MKITTKCDIRAYWAATYLTMKGRTTPSLFLIRRLCCEAVGVSIENVESQNRKREYVYARQLYCFFAWEYTYCSLNRIATLIGDRDHSTITHSRETIKTLAPNQIELLKHKAEIELIISDRFNKVQRERYPSSLHVKGAWLRKRR